MNRPPTRTSRSVVLLVLLIAVTLVAIFFHIASASAGVTTPPTGFQPFAPDSPVNQQLRDDAPIHARSAEWVNWMVNDPTNGVGSPGHVGYFNASGCNMPTYWATTSTPKVQVKLDPNRYQDQSFIAAWKQVPYDEANMPPANCSDGNIAVLQQQSDGTVTEWEFWKLRRGTWACAAGTTCAVGSSANWQFTPSSTGDLYAAHGGVTQNVEKDRGFASPQQWVGNPSDPIFTARKAAWNMNVTATGMNVTAGVVTPEDVANADIDHMVGLAVPDALAGKFLWPAQRYDGGLTETATRKPLPEGATLRIPASFDLEAWLTAHNSPPLVKYVARAAQKYGIFVRDRTWSSWSFYGQQVPDGQTNPYSAAMDGQTYFEAFTSKFPWAELKVLDRPMCTGVSGTGCRPGTAQHVDIQIDSQVPTVGAPLTLDTRNSLLEFPRAKVEVDVDGDGTYEVDAGTSAKPVVTPANPGARTLSVKITQRGGQVHTGTLELTVGPDEEVLKPNSIFGGNGQFTSTSGTLLDGVTTPGEHILHHTSGAKVTYDIEDPAGPVSGATVKAFVTADALLNIEVQALSSTGVYMGSGSVPFGGSGPVQFNVTGNQAAIAGMRIRPTGTSLSGWTSANEATLSDLTVTSIP